MSKISHQNIREMIQAGVPLEPADEQRLAEHLADCAECREFATYHQFLLKAIPQEYPRAHLTNAQTQRLAAEAKTRLARQSATRKVLGGFGSVASIGAAIVLVALLGYGLIRLLPEQGKQLTGALERTPQKLVTSTLLASPASTKSASYPQETPGAAQTQPGTAPSPVFIPTPVGQVSAANVKAELQAQSGGTVNGVVVVGNTAYVGLGPRVAAIDISQPASPRLIAQTPPLPGVVTRLLKLPGGANIRLAAAAGSTLVTLEVTAPGQIDVTGQAILPGSVNAMLVELNAQILYATGQVGGNTTGYIVSVDLSDPAHPRGLAQLALAQSAQSLALGNGTLYIGLSATNQISASVIAITGEALGKLTKVETVITDLEVRSMSATGNRLYVGSFMSMLAYDITDPLNLKQVWKAEQAGVNQPLSMIDGFELRSDTIYTAGLMPAGGYVFSRLAFVPPEPVPSSSTVETASIVAVNNGLMVVTGDGLEIYAIGASGSLKQIGFFRPEQSLTFAVAVKGDYVYALQQASKRGNPEPDTLRTLHLPDLQEVSAIHLDHSQDQATQWGWYRGMTIFGDRLYLFDGYGRNWIFSLTHPEKPELLSRPEILSADLLTGTVGLSGDRLLMFMAFLSSGDTQESNLVVYDAGDGARVKDLRTALTVPERVYRLAWDGSTLLALSEGPTQDVNTLYLISFQQDQLVLEGKVSLPGYGLGIGFLNDWAVVSAGNELVTVSLANPQQPAIVSQVLLPAANAVMVLEGRVAWVWAADGGSAQFLAYDLSQPVGTTPVFNVDVPSHDSWLLAPDILGWSGPYLVMGGYSSGVEVWQVSVK